MKRILLYQDITTGTINTLTEMKSQYEIENNCNLSISDDEMETILRDQLWSVGGNLLIISCNDPILAWCHEYATEMEAERYLSKTEIEYSIKECYEGIINADEYILQPIRDNLYNGNRNLLDRLNEITKEVK